MLLGKNIKYIALLAIAGVLIYYFFFRKKSATISVEKPVSNSGSVPEIKPVETSESETPVSSDYVGPQDCAENCDTPHGNLVLSCYNKIGMPGLELDACLNNAEIKRQECLGKCSQTIPRYINLDQNIATPLQEENYFSNLFRQGYV